MWTRTANPATIPSIPTDQKGRCRLCDASGRVLGLMPTRTPRAPDAASSLDPTWTGRRGEGLRLFHNAVRYFESWTWSSPRTLKANSWKAYCRVGVEEEPGGEMLMLLWDASG